MFNFVVLVVLFLTSGQNTSFADEQIKETRNITINYIPLEKVHPCSRPCLKNAPPMTCRYHFNVEWYQTMSKACHSCPFDKADCDRPDCIAADGNIRNVLVINRKIPGTSIEVCYGDEVIVDVQNNLIDMSTTIHWHGHPQRGTPYMDGVPWVTQCPIQPGTTFRYRLQANIIGTNMWHSHSGMQRTDGAFGPFIIRLPDHLNPHRKSYDHDLSEHTMIITDWMEHTGMQKFISHYHSVGDNKPTSILVNGKGKFAEFKDKNGSVVYTPLAKFTVKKGLKYRFRIINVSFMNCPLEMSIDNHTMTIISTDGHDVQPQEADSLVSYAGERFDFILHANRDDDAYWMRFRGLMDCDERFTSAFQTAVLKYSNSDKDIPSGDHPNYKNSDRSGLQVNALNKAMEDDTIVSIPDLKSLAPPDLSLKEIPDFKYYISYDFYKINNPLFHKEDLYSYNDVKNDSERVQTPQLNHITMKMPPVPVLQSRYWLKPEMFCNETTLKNCDRDFCECTHLVQIPLGMVVELILIDKGFAYDANHPFHLHGTHFRVIGMERIGKTVTVGKIINMDKNGLLKRTFSNPPLKDTVTVPDGGYTIVRFVADNPGYWLFHCHIEFHAEIGMALIFKFGEDDDMPPVPPKFPQCGNYFDLPAKPYPQKVTSSNIEKEEEDKRKPDENNWLYNLFSNNGCEHCKAYSFYLLFSVLVLPLIAYC